MGTRQRREREKAQRRQDIVDTARSLFWENGYSKTTMQEIAEKTELAPGTLYLYFPNKDALYAELLIEGFDLLSKRLKGGVSKRKSLKNQADDLVNTFFLFARECPEYFEIIFFMLHREGRIKREDVLEKDQIDRINLKEATCKAVVAEVLEGVDHKNIDVLVDAVWSMLVGVILYFQGRPEKFNDVSKEAKKLILDAVCG